MAVQWQNPFSGHCAVERAPSPVGEAPASQRTARYRPSDRTRAVFSNLGAGGRAAASHSDHQTVALSPDGLPDLRPPVPRKSRTSGGKNECLFML